MTRVPRIYVAGPYTKPDPVLNVRRAVLAADVLLAYGFAPFVPHLSHLWHTISPKPYEAWIALDLAWLATCDVMVRLTGESSGADVERSYADEHAIPCFEWDHSPNVCQPPLALIAWHNTWRLHA